jgi:hypothetical protein
MNLSQISLGSGSTVLFENPTRTVVEPIDGPASLESIMDRFPESVYNRSRDTRLYKFLTAVTGDAGAGWLKKKTLNARLKTEGPLLVFRDADSLYSTAFRFERLKREIYNYDPSSSALEKQVWDAIYAADISYRKRILDFFVATRFGGSPYGIALAAKAGSGYDTDVVENYKYIFDLKSDDILGLEKLGDSPSLGEFIVYPRVLNNLNSAEDKFRITLTNDEATNTATTGTYILSYAGQASVPISPFLPAADLEFILNNISPLEPGDVSVKLTTSHSYEITINNTDLSSYYFTLNSNSITLGTVSIDHEAPVDFYVSEWSGPSSQWYFDNYIAMSQAYTGGPRADLIGNPTTTTSFLSGNFTNTPSIQLDPEIERSMVSAVDKIRPVSSMMTVRPKNERYFKVAARSVQASSEKINIVRFVTGKENVSWPQTNVTTGEFIRGRVLVNDPVDGQISIDVENEETNWSLSDRAIPVIFHSVDSVFVYREEALLDIQYNTSNFYSDAYYLYKSEHIGKFGSISELAYPFLKTITDEDIFRASLLLPSSDTPLIFSGR